MKHLALATMLTALPVDGLTARRRRELEALERLEEVKRVLPPTVSTSRPPTIRGQVVSAKTGEPVSGAVVCLEGERPTLDVTGRAGYYEVEARRPGRQSIRVVGEDGEAAVFRTEVSGADPEIRMLAVAR